jgi:hypothetical protein
VSGRDQGVRRTHDNGLRNAVICENLTNTRLMELSQSHGNESEPERGGKVRPLSIQRLYEKFLDEICVASNGRELLATYASDERAKG